MPEPRFGKGEEGKEIVEEGGGMNYFLLSGFILTAVLAFILGWLMGAKHAYDEMYAESKRIMGQL